MTQVFSETDRGMATIRHAISASKHTNFLLNKHGRLTNKLPISVPHFLAFGPGGTGKTTGVEQAAKMMGCTEEEGSFIRINSSCIDGIEDLVKILSEKLSWEGYLCNQGKTDHCNCSNCSIIDPINPRASVKPQLVFMDEIHVLSKALQELLGLIILDFRYQINTPEGLKTVYFPRFTFAAATTKPGELIKPLRTRFGIKIPVTSLSDEESYSVVESMVGSRGWVVDDGAKRLIAQMSQGIPREADNHLIGLYSSWIHGLTTGQHTQKYAITKEVADKYAELQQFTLDGLTNDQVRVLTYLSSLNKGEKVVGAGVTRICSVLGIDTERFSDEVEPRLVHRGLLCSGNRGREITQKGLAYLKTIKTEDF